MKHELFTEDIRDCLEIINSTITDLDFAQHLCLLLNSKLKLKDCYHPLGQFKTQKEAHEKYLTGIVKLDTKGEKES